MLKREAFWGLCIWKGCLCNSQHPRQLITILTSPAASMRCFWKRFDQVHKHWPDQPYASHFCPKLWLFFTPVCPAIRYIYLYIYWPAASPPLASALALIKAVIVQTLPSVYLIFSFNLLAVPCSINWTHCCEGTCLVKHGAREIWMNLKVWTWWFLLWPHWPSGLVAWSCDMFEITWVLSNTLRLTACLTAQCLWVFGLPLMIICINDENNI